ncbi:unnamed protein product [Paramecium sonneborni]|uniref:Uncharacterized protein n=1 Tax=Paramecium sonneborni TaxID=65129 RepID=A0A8S1P8R3_9CILI|nr:unnamed protein product [Paramecium sonneborni]
MLLHHAIRIVEKNQPINDSSNLTNLDFKLFNQTTGKKYDYPVFGKQCNHFGDKFIDLQNAVDGFNSQERQYQCPHCDQIYKEISDFTPHDLFKKIQNEFHPQTNTISIVHGILVSHIKRNKKRFGDPLISDKIKNSIIDLLTQREDDPFQKASQSTTLAQLDQRLKTEFQIQFQSMCLLDNVNINIPVRHKDCKHIQAYELTSLISYQIENYRDQKNNQLKQRDTVRYLKCQQSGCHSIFPLYSEIDLINSLVVDFQFLQTIKKAYPGNQLYIINKTINNEILLTDWISNSTNTKDKFIYQYWAQKENKIELEKLFSYDEFQRNVLEKMATIMNLEQPKAIKEKINQYKNSICWMKLKDYSNQMVEYPTRCVNCPIPKPLGEKQQDIIEPQQDNIKPLNNWDIRTFIAYIIHKKKKAEVKKQNTEKLKCPLCENEFKKNLVQMQFNNELIFYDAQLYQKMQNRLSDIKYEPDNLFEYRGKDYLLENFKNLWKYSVEDFLNDENVSENGKIQYKTIKCHNFRDLYLKNPLINFKCKNQIRFNFDYFYKKFQENNFQFKNGIKLCQCQETECELVTEIEGQLYYDHVYNEAYKNKPTHCNCDQGFEYDLKNKKFRELKQGEYVMMKLIAPIVRHFKEDEQLERGLSFKYQQQGQRQQIRQQSIMEQ